MSGFIDWVDPVVLAPAFLIGMLGAWAFGWWCGRNAVPQKGEDPGIKFTDAALALLGLLLAFTFSLSLQRHDQRRETVLADSNAVGDFYTCASLLREPHRSRLQGVIREYAQRKRDLRERIRSEADLQEELRRFQTMQSQMTTLVAEAVGEGTPIAVSLTNTLNGLTSADASSLAAFRGRLPWSIVLLLFLGAVVPSFLMGLQQGKSPRPHISGTVCFLFMVTLVVYVTLDLNQPGSGTITVSREPFERLLRSMGP